MFAQSIASGYPVSATNKQLRWPAQGNIARKHITKGILIAICTAFLIAFSGQVAAQIDTGSVTGTVKDPSGALVAGAHCTLTNAATNISQTALSTSAGAYTFEAVKAGTYSLKVAAPGFKEYRLNGVEVHVQDTVTADVSLQMGATSAEVTVTSAVPLLQAQDASVGMTINSKMVNDLPIQGGGGGRNFTTLAELAPGVYSNGNPDTTTILASGVENGQVDVRFNGVDDNAGVLRRHNRSSHSRCHSGVQIHEWRQQRRVWSLNRRGDQCHHLHRDEPIPRPRLGVFPERGSERQRLLQQLESRKPRSILRHNEFGGLLGGPVLLPHYNGRNRTFFFFDFQRTMHANPNAYTQTVPTATMQKSGFTNMQDLFTLSTSTHTDALGRKFQYGTIFDPATTRVIPVSGVDPVTGLTGKAGSYIRDPFYNCTRDRRLPAERQHDGQYHNGLHNDSANGAPQHSAVIAPRLRTRLRCWRLLPNPNVTVTSATCCRTTGIQLPPKYSARTNTTGESTRRSATRTRSGEATPTTIRLRRLRLPIRGQRKVLCRSIMRVRVPFM